MDVELLQKTSMTSSRFWLRLLATTLPVLLGLGGCGGPTSVTSLRDRPHRVYSFEVPADYETVYLRLSRRARVRYRYTDRTTYQPGVTAKLAPEAQSATVTLWNAGGIGLRYLLTADLRALDPARTAVSLYCASRSAAKEAALWQQWAHTPFESTPVPAPPQSEALQDAGQSEDPAD
jgi:hypothetical protein